MNTSAIKTRLECSAIKSEKSLKSLNIITVHLIWKTKVTLQSYKQVILNFSFLLAQ